MKILAAIGTLLAVHAFAADQPLNPKDALAPIFRENPALTDPAADVVRLRNEGIAHLEGGLTLDKGIAAFQTAYERGHDPVDAFNLALVYLKQQKVPDARVWAGKSLENNETFPNGQYLLGLIEKLDGHPAEALARWTRTSQLYPADANLHYELAMLASAAKDEHVFLQELLRALELDPEHKSSLYQMYRYHQASGNKEMAASTLKRFNAVKANERFTRKERPLDESSFTRPLRADPLRGAAGFPFMDSVIAMTAVHPDIACKLTQLVPVTSLTGPAHEDLIGVCADGTLTRIAGGNATAIGTLDGQPAEVRVEWLDTQGPRVIAAGASGVKLSSPIGTSPLTFEPLDDLPARHVLLADFEHDGSLDILSDATGVPLARVDGKFKRLPNGYANTALAHAFAGTGAVTSADPRRRGIADLTIPAGHDVKIVSGGADGYRDAPSVHISDTDDVTQAAWVDFDNDGMLDLVAVAGNELSIHWGKTGGAQAEIARVPLAGKAPFRFAVADFNNDGRRDILAIGADGAAAVLMNKGPRAFEQRALAAVPVPASDPVVLDENRDGLPDIAYIDTGGHPVVLRNASKNTGKSIDILLNGKRSPVTGQLTQVELRKGPLYAYGQSSGGLVHFGLGAQDYAEVIRLEWPNGFVENKIKVDAATTPYVYLESERIAGSCPTIFVRGPNGFRYVTDAMITTAVGILEQRGEYFGFGDREHVVIPPGMLTEANGRLDIRVTEELRETTYIDKAALLAVDLPAGARLGSTDKLAMPVPGTPPWYAARRLVPAARATFEGRDVTALLARRDQRYADTVHRTRNPGFAGQSVLELELSAGTDPAKVDAVYATGWFLAFDSTAVIGAFKGESPSFQFPELQENIDGEWKTVGVLGIPAGQNRTAVLPLKQPLRSRHLRILSGFSVYWDELAFSIAGQAPAKVAELPLMDAALRFHGFSKTISKDPEVFDYSDVDYRMIWSPMPGRFTNYGSVTDLLTRKDGAYAAIGGGDEIALSFRAPAAPPPPGFERTYILVLDGHVKDADRYTAMSDAVEPMPGLSMTSYPPGPGTLEPPLSAQMRQRAGLDYTLRNLSNGKETGHE